MRVEDITIDHIRRQQVVTVEQYGKKIISIPVGFHDERIAISDSNLFRWHDKETCQDILHPAKDAWQYAYYPSVNQYTFTRCFGECVPNQKIIPWDTERFIHAHYTFIHTGWKTKRIVKFASGDELYYYIEVNDDSDK